MSPLRQALEEYLAVRRALGFKLCEAGYVLRRFVAFAEAQGASAITTELALAWAQQTAQSDPVVWARRLGFVRRFARHCAGLDPLTEVPPKDLFPAKYRRRPAYLYSDTEILRLLEAAKSLRSRSGLRAPTIATLLGLMAVTGMRTREPINLDREDVDLANGVITIRQSKFGKSRCVPIDKSTQVALEQYQLCRDRLCPHPRTPAFFVTGYGMRVMRVTPFTLRYNFLKLSRQIGLRRPSDRRGPRLHDLRHSFTLRALLGWYKNGIDVERQLPRLATYLGHAHAHHTYWYLSATPELLQAAAMRLEDTDLEPRP
jgi:integrase/recombinase XerD